MPNQSCSSGVAAMLIGCVPRAARPRLVDQVDRESAAQEDILEPLAPSGVVSHVLADCRWPCQKTSGSFLAFTGTW